MFMTILCNYTYQESTSDASDTSSVTAVSGSPPRSRKVHSDEDDKRILSWAEDVANSDSDSDNDGLHTVCSLNLSNASHCILKLIIVQGPSSTELHDLHSRKEATKGQRMEAQKRREDELRDAHRNLEDTLRLARFNIHGITGPPLLLLGKVLVHSNFNDQALSFTFLPRMA